MVGFCQSAKPHCLRIWIFRTASGVVAIFMNVFDVHVNRAPVAGHVTATSYHKGAFLNASLDKASEANERQNIVMETTAGSR